MSELTIHAEPGIEVWTINGEARRNALSRALVSELAERVASLKTTAAAERPKVVVLTGAGTRAFCAGADLKERASMSEPEVRAFLTALNATFRSLEQSDAIFIAAINGAAFGGGTELALCCDFRLMTSNAELGLTEVKLGIIPGAGGTQRLARLVGLARAKELILTGRRIQADEALSLGLTSRICPTHRLISDAIELGRTLVSNAPLALAAAKHAIDEGWGRSLDEGLAIEQREYQKCLNSEDRLEGLRAFAEKRAPVFKGR